MSARLQGLRAWLMQRVTAIYIAGYLLIVLAVVLSHVPHSYEEWRAFMMAPLMNVATILLFAALLMHAWIGVRNILLDYVQAFALRLMSLIVLGGVLMAMGVWVLKVLLSGAAS